MGKIAFQDSTSRKSKNLRFVHTEDDIILEVPNEDGKLVSTHTLARTLNAGDTGVVISQIFKPDITENNGGIRDEVGHNDPLIIATYKTSEFFVGPHEETEWEAYSSPTLERRLDRTSSKEHLTRWLPNISDRNQPVYVRYRFKSSGLISPWSDLLHYITPNFGIEPFTITVSENTLTPTITTSGFRSFGSDIIGGINHRSTSYKILSQRNEVIYSSIENDRDFIRHTIPEGILHIDTVYTVEVIYHSTNNRYYSSKPVRKQFKTPNFYINRPTARYEFKNGMHNLIGSTYKFVGSINEPHISTTWILKAREASGAFIEIYRAENSTEYKTSINISNIANSSQVEYVVELQYFSPNYKSAKTTIRFRPMATDVKTLTLGVVDSTNNLPTLKVGPFDVNNEIDSVQGIVVRVTNPKYDEETSFEKYTIHNGKYRVPMDIPIGANKLREWLGNGKYTFIPGDKLKISAYVIGNVYNSNIALVDYTPSARVTLDATSTSTDKDNVSLRLHNISNYGAHSWLTISSYQIEIFKGVSSSPLHVSNHILASTEVTYRIPATVSLEYDTDYKFKVYAQTFLGKMFVKEGVFRVPSLIIETPVPRVEIEPINNNRMKWHISTSAYASRPEDRIGKEHIKTIYKVYDALNGTLLRTIEGTPTGGTAKGLTSCTELFNKADIDVTYNRLYRLGVTYVAARGTMSAEGLVNVPIGDRPPVIIGTPVITPRVTDKLINVTSSPFTISGLENGVHVKTSWRLKEGSQVLHQSINDARNLVSYTFPEDITQYGKTYTVEATYIANNNSASNTGSVSVKTKTTADAFLDKLLLGGDVDMGRVRIEVQEVGYQKHNRGRGYNDIYGNIPFKWNKYANKYKGPINVSGSYSYDYIGAIGLESRIVVDNTPVSNWELTGTLLAHHSYTHSSPPADQCNNNNSMN